jgi:hypothetical protein
MVEKHAEKLCGMRQPVESGPTEPGLVGYGPDSASYAASGRSVRVVADS